MQGIYEFLENQALGPERAEQTVKRWNERKLRRFFDEVWRVLRLERPSHPRSPYQFVANGELSGGPIPCMALECRVANVDRLARFAALYSDFVVIQDPFPRLPDDSIDVDWLRGRVAADIQVLHHVSPLVEAGLATVTTKALAFCREHIPEVIKSGGTQRAARALRSEFGPKLRIVQESDSPIQVIRVEGPEALLEHGSQFIVRPQSEPLSLGRANRFGHRPLIGASRKQAIDSLISPIIEDLIQASAHSRAQRLTYLTNREADVAALNAANPPDLAEFSESLIQGLAHSLPFIEDIDIADLVALRQKDGAAFQVYRDSVSRVLRELTSRDAKKARQAFQDVVLPHLSDIDLALSNAKKVAIRKIATNVAIGTGLVAVGLTTGLLPPNVGQIIASLGGLQAGANALQGMIELLAEPEAVRQNKYYFLWKARRHAAANKPANLALQPASPTTLKRRG